MEFDLVLYIKKEYSLILLCVGFISIILTMGEIAAEVLKQGNLEHLRLDYLILESLDGLTNDSKMRHYLFKNVFESMQLKFYSQNVEGFKDCILGDSSLTDSDINTFNRRFVFCSIFAQQSLAVNFNTFKVISRFIKNVLLLTEIAIGVVSIVTIYHNNSNEINKIRHYLLGIINIDKIPFHDKMKDNYNNDSKSPCTSKRKPSLNNSSKEKAANVNILSDFNKSKDSTESVNNIVKTAIDKLNKRDYIESSESSTFSSISLPTFFLNKKSSTNSHKDTNVYFKENVDYLSGTKRSKHEITVDNLNNKLDNALKISSVEGTNLRPIDLAGEKSDGDNGKVEIATPVKVNEPIHCALETKNLNEERPYPIIKKTPLNFDLITTKGRAEWKNHLLKLQETKNKRNEKEREHFEFPNDNKLQVADIQNIRLFDPSGKPLRRVVIPGIGWVPHRRAQMILNKNKTTLT
ncbi:hypothetical protein TPHA_0G00460 [Tetrapisispora phaffii CBS 4417]|uniref:Uncharacterized protein n=1 Tax=Tetrapisispora phaffii (strain ATCC 24235 / CBS 4417 / NBRC 1672 / NRRL Y-8282 / UCD 70-5) TaxID=1071381 RepID=G8BVF4_TETPH|nr:hypothetical protein TPHA_0G00460 [Tetrapisispora phaffii CBS 4417]CCE63882.1 hypothetical protein TPHA_0G00460 [Tetrapisispora phaffii CBS 4417]